MDTPLGFAVGNAVEVRESIDVLRGGGPEEVRELTLELGAEMLIAGHAAPDRTSARERLERALASGAAFERFCQVVEAQGGDVHAIEDPERLPRPSAVRAVRAERGGFLTGLDAGLVGLAAVDLGAGRERKEDAVDPAAGLVLAKKPGDEVRPGDLLAELHAATEARLDRGEARLRSSIAVGAEKPAKRALVLERIG
jgi:thymidine phosphorylase